MWQTLLVLAVVMVAGWVVTRLTENLLLIGGLRDDDETARRPFAYRKRE